MMWGTCGYLSAVAAINASQATVDYHKQRRDMMRETLSPEEFKEWEIKETEERRHREVCDAIRATKPDPVQPKDDSMSLFKVILGAGIIGSMIDD